MHIYMHIYICIYSMYIDVYQCKYYGTLNVYNGMLDIASGSHSVGEIKLAQSYRRG